MTLHGNAHDQEPAQSAHEDESAVPVSAVPVSAELEPEQAEFSAYVSSYKNVVAGSQQSEFMLATVYHNVSPAESITSYGSVPFVVLISALKHYPD